MKTQKPHSPKSMPQNRTEDATVKEAAKVHDKAESIDGAHQGSTGQRSKHDR